MTILTSQPVKSFDLAQFVRLNEGIKHVVLIAFQINIMAINAILLSRRAGVLASGFGVISNELRSLSAQLTQDMQGVQFISHHILNDLTHEITYHKHKNLWHKTQTLLSISLDSLDKMQQDQEKKHHDILIIRQTLQAQLLTHLRETQQLCLYGLAISRSAKIEAAYGREFSVALSEVSRDFDEKIQAILPSIESLCIELSQF